MTINNDIVINHTILYILYTRHWWVVEVCATSEKKEEKSGGSWVHRTIEINKYCYNRVYI